MHTCIKCMRHFCVFCSESDCDCVIQITSANRAEEFWPFHRMRISNSSKFCMICSSINDFNVSKRSPSWILVCFNCKIDTHAHTYTNKQLSIFSKNWPLASSTSTYIYKSLSVSTAIRYRLDNCTSALLDLYGQRFICTCITWDSK